MRERTVGGGLVGERAGEGESWLRAAKVRVSLIVLLASALALVTHSTRPTRSAPVHIYSIYSSKYRYTQEKSFFESSGYRFTAST